MRLRRTTGFSPSLRPEAPDQPVKRNIRAAGGGTFDLLLVDGSSTCEPALGELIDSSAGHGCSLERTSDLDSGIARLGEAHFDVLFLCANRGEESPGRAVARIQKEAPSVPVIVLAPEPSPGHAAEAMREGAQDYLTREELSVREFPRVIRRAIERQRFRRRLARTHTGHDSAAQPFEGPDGGTARGDSEDRARQLAREQEAREQAEAAEHRSQFLAHAAVLLDSSLDYQETLHRLAGLVVPELADWCIIDVLEEEGPPLRVAAGVEEEKNKLLRELEKEFPLDRRSRQPAAEVLRSGERLLIDDMSDEELGERVLGPRHREVLEKLSVRSVLAVPLIARSRTLGVMTLLAASPGRWSGEADVRLAEELAQRAALTVDNSRLYRNAQLANKAKSDFLAVMSHELRTPLNSIIGYVDILQDQISGELNDTQLEQLSRVMISSQHLLQLIEEILTFSRMEAGREKLRVDRVAIPDLLRDVESVALPLAREKGLEFRITGVEDVTMRTDQRKLRQILLNLLTNAVKFTEEGEVAVHVDIESDEVVFHVSDTGRGIDLSHANRIFEPFWQEEQPRTRSTGGTGLGLSVAKRLSILLAGDITVESEPGEGTTFSVRIARELDGSEGEQNPEQNESAGEGRRAAGAGSA